MLTYSLLSRLTLFIRLLLVVSIHEGRTWVRLVERSFNLFNYNQTSVKAPRINLPTPLGPT